MKKGIELSINFLVTIVIALTIFIFGVRFIYNIAGSATDIEDITTKELDDRIGQLLCESTDRVCIGIDKKIIQKGKFGVFGIKITNIFDKTGFEIQISRPTPSGYTKNNIPIPAADDKLEAIYGGDTSGVGRSETLERNEEKEIGVGIDVPRDAKSGTYIFDVVVKYNTDLGAEPYGGIHKLYVEVP